MKLTKSLTQKYRIEIESQRITCIALPSPITIFTIQSEPLRVNWSGVGNNWLRRAKRDLLKVIGV